MKKGALIELVYLAVNGGQASSDSNVWMADISAYLPAAAAQAIIEQTYQEKGMERSTGEYVSGIDQGAYMTPFTGKPVKNGSGFKLVIPRPLALPNGWGIGNVHQASNPSISWSPVGSVAELAGLGDTPVRLFWHESDASESRLCFLSLPQPVCDMTAMLVVSPDRVALDEELPWTSGVEHRVIEICKAHFFQQKQFPADVVADQRDTNAT